MEAGAAACLTSSVILCKDKNIVYCIGFVSKLNETLFAKLPFVALIELYENNDGVTALFQIPLQKAEPVISNVIRQCLVTRSQTSNFAMVTI